MAFDKLNGMEVETFGQRLKRLREAAGLSQRALARRAGLSNGTISQAEDERLWVGQAPSIDIVRALADALGVEEEVLVPRGKRQPLPDDQRESVPSAFDAALPDAENLSDAEVIAFAESIPDPMMQADLRRFRDRLSDAEYLALCRDVHRVVRATAAAVVATRSR